MIYSTDFEELAGKISHIDVAQYLRDLGWNEVATKTNLVNIFQYESPESFFQVDLPTSRDLRDYKNAMFRAVESIARSAMKSTEHVILELLNPLSDILRIRVQESSAQAGSLFVEDAIKLYENAKKLLTFAAMDVERPQLFHSGRPPAGISEFIGQCKFGQTEIGSYVVSVVCPFAFLDNSQMVQLTLFSETEECAYSLTRKTINKLISSVNTVKEAIQQGNLEKISENNISANFLDALSGINIYRKDSVLDLTVKYAPTISINTLTVSSATIDHDYYEPIDTLVKRIKHIHEDEKTYIGRIRNLNAPPDLAIREQGMITIVYLDETDKKSSASVILSINDYNAAIEAHRTGNPVKIIGTMSRQPRSKSIKCNYFEVL